MQAIRTLLRIALGAAASALLLTLALPPSDWHLLGWFWMVPLLLSLRRSSARFGVYGGFACLLMTAALAQSGLVYREKWPQGETGWIWLGIVIFAFAPAFSAAFYAGLKERRVWHPFFLAAFAVCIEGALLLYLPGNLALTQNRAWPMLFVASLGGIWLVSYLLWYVNFLAAEAIAEKEWRRLALVGGGAALLSALALIPKAAETGDFKVAALQTDSGFPGDLEKLNRQAGEQGAKIVVWPELSAISIVHGGDAKPLVELAAKPDQPPFITSFSDPVDGRKYNAAAIYSAAGESPRYFKRKPFGSESKEHSAGREPVVVSAIGHKFGLAICFDTCFPYILRDLEKAGPYEAILVPTLDPPTRHTFVQSIHAAWGPFRAAELGVPIIQADTTARSQILDANGLRVQEAGTGEQIIFADIRLGRKPTMARIVGDGFLYLCVLGFAAGLGVMLKARRESKGKEQ